MKSARVSAALAITGMLILGIGGGYAQSNLASVSGVVSDPQGAVVLAAAVSATNTATGVDTKTATDDAGFYAIRNLPIGAYTLTIEHLGFRRYVQQGMILTTGQSLGLDVRLELGEATQTVIAHDRRRILRCNVTRHPTGAWVSQQLREAFPYDSAPSYLIFDRAANFNGKVISTMKSVGGKPKRTSFRSPLQNGVAER